MNLNKNFVLLSLGLLFTGCYTQFSTIQPPNYPDQQYTGTEVDTLTSTDSSKARVDTVVTKEREVCVWERNLMGYPELRCFESNYYSDYWYNYNYTPWWYRYDRYWSGYNRNHRYYYDNPYYDNYHHGYDDYYRGGGGGSYSNPGNDGKVPSRNRSPGLNTVPGNSSLNKNNIQPPPEKGPEPPHRNRSEGLSGSPQGDNLQKSTSNENPSNVQSGGDPGTQGSSTPAAPEQKQVRRPPRSRF
jgi:hypothetical protein